jgi:glyoxylase-like metal-dependent hydrolase (beta-lactamase superfamily II)
MGDTFTTSGYPFIDLESGGHVDGFLTAADRVLAIAKPTTKIIPGHGPVSDRVGLQAWRQMIATIRDRVAKGVAAKKTLAEVQAGHPTQEFDAKWGNTFIKPDMLVQLIYEDLSAAKPAAAK